MKVDELKQAADDGMDIVVKASTLWLLLDRANMFAKRQLSTIGGDQQSRLSIEVQDVIENCRRQ